MGEGVADPRTAAPRGELAFEIVRHLVVKERLVDEQYKQH
eukprot:gene7295-6463_t